MKNQIPCILQRHEKCLAGALSSPSAALVRVSGDTPLSEVIVKSILPTKIFFQELIKCFPARNLTGPRWFSVLLTSWGKTWDLSNLFEACIRTFGQAKFGWCRVWTLGEIGPPDAWQLENNSVAKRRSFHLFLLGCRRLQKVAAGCRTQGHTLLFGSGLIFVSLYSNLKEGNTYSQREGVTSCEQSCELYVGLRLWSSNPVRVAFWWST